MGQPPWPVIAVVACMYTASTSGRSSRSTLMFTKCSFMYAAVAASSNDSCAITWHQWQAAYPTLGRLGRADPRAPANPSGDHSHQSTGLSWCCRRYGDVAFASRFATGLLPSEASVLVERPVPRNVRPNRHPARARAPTTVSKRDPGVTLDSVIGCLGVTQV